MSRLASSAHAEHPFLVNLENSAPPTEPLVMNLTEVGKEAGQWSLTLHADHLELKRASEAQPIGILRDELMRSAVLIEGMKVFAVNKPLKVNFALTADATTTIAEWIGLPFLAASYLRRRYGWVLPVAVIWMVGALPISGDPASGFKPVAFDPIGFALGATLVLSWVFAKWRPNAVLFLVDSIWFAIMSGHLVMSVVNGWSKTWLLLLIPLLWMAVTGVKHYYRFRGIEIDRRVT